MDGDGYTSPHLFRPPMFKNLDAILSAYTVDEINSAVIIHDEATHLFSVYPSPRALYDAILLQPTTPSWHEVIIPGRPQRLRIDLDIPIKELRKINIDPRPPPIAEPEYCDECQYPVGSCEKCAIASNIAAAENSDDIRAKYVLREVIDAYRVACPRIDFVLCTAHSNARDETGKYSFHLISYAFSETSHHVHHICEKIRRLLMPEVAQFYDASVCSIGTHNLRLAGCIKLNDPRIKRVRPRRWYRDKFEMWRDSLVTFIGPLCVPIVSDVPVRPPSASSSTTHPGDAAVNDHILETLRPFHDGLVFIGTRGPILRYNRIRASTCSICRRPHERENSFYAILHAGGAYATLHCRRSNEILRVDF